MMMKSVIDYLFHIMSCRYPLLKFNNINLLLVLQVTIPSSRMPFLQFQSYLDAFLFSGKIPITAIIIQCSPFFFFLVYLTSLTISYLGQYCDLLDFELQVPRTMLSNIIATSHVFIKN